MRKELVIEGGFDLFHQDHRRFIDQCIHKFNEIYGYQPVLLIRVMSNLWCKKKGPYRPYQDVKERMDAIRNFLINKYIFSISEAALASFEYENDNEFNGDFLNKVIAISSENVPKIKIQYNNYMIVEPVNKFHTTDIEKQLMEMKNNSKCKVRKVGSILLKDGEIIASAHNSCLCSINNTCKGCMLYLEGEINKSREFGCSSIHSETAVLERIKNSEDNKNLILITTTAPCKDCALQILKSGIKQVIYLDEWNRSSENGKRWFVDNSGIDLLDRNNFDVKKAGI